MIAVALALGRHLGRHPWALGLALLGIALGVGMATAIDLAIASSRRAFGESLAGVTGRATHQIVAGPSGIADAEFARLRTELAPLPLAPVVESVVALADRPGRVLRLTGIDPLSEPPFRPYLGRLTGGDTEALAALMTRPGTVALERGAAEALEVRVGDRLALLVSTRRVEATLAAVVDAGDAYARRALADVLLCDIATAQEILGRRGVIDRIDLIATDADAPRLAAARLPPAAELGRAESRGHALEQMTAAFHLNLTAMGLLALLVGVFLIYNTVGFLVVQRRELIARLRLHGATRGAIAAVVLIEAAAVGAVGSALGLVAGLAAARTLVDGVSRTINDFWFVVAVRDVALPPGLLALNLGIGIAASVGAALAPALDAARTRPAAAIAASAYAERARRWAPLVALVGVACGGLSAALLAWGGSSVALGFAAMALAIVACALVTPLILGIATMLAARPLGAMFGPIAAMAARSVRATLGRTGVAVAALAVACAASLGVGIMVGSFRLALIDWLDAALRADVYVSAPRAVSARIGEVPLDPDLVARLSAVPGVAAVIVKRDARPATSVGRVDVTAFDLPREARGSFRFVTGDPATAWDRVEAGAALVTAPFAMRHGLGLGDELRFATDRGERAATIVGVVKDYSSDQGTVLMALGSWRAWYDDRGISAFSAFAAPDVTPDELVARLRAASGGHELWISSNRDLRRESLAVFDRTFAVTDAIRLLSGGVAFLGVLSALLALALERAREIALLRMHGCTPAQAAGLIAGQAAITGIAAGVLAIPLGAMLAAMLTQVINRRSFGWSFDLRIDPAEAAVTVALALGASLLAAVWPCWRAFRQTPAAALRGE